MSSSDFKFKLFHFTELVSTNIYALDRVNAKKANHGDLYWTDYQQLGKGLRGNVWKAERAKNLLFSLVIKPNLIVEKQFYLSMLVANSIANLLDSLAELEVKVKWPNDILLNRKKVAGILIENSLSGSVIRSSVIGIGLNVNQDDFGELEEKASSLKLLLNQVFEREVLLKKWESYFQAQYRKLLLRQFKEIKSEYLSRLYAFNEVFFFESQKSIFKGEIIGISPEGRLVLKKEGGFTQEYDLKEIKFIEKV